MKFSQFKNLTGIHWILLALLLLSAAWLFKPEKVATAQSTNHRFALPNLWVSEFSIQQGWTPEHPRMLADINGDKIQDIVGFGIHGVWRSIAPPALQASFVLEEFGYDQGWRVDKHVRTMADISGDQKDDIVGFGNGGVYRAISDGSGFGAMTFAVEDFGYDQGWRNDKHVRLLADINGDTKKDVVGFGEEGVWVSLATSAAGDLSAPFLAVPDFGYLQGWRVDRHIRTTADVNGDTFQDIVAFGEHGVWVALSIGTGFAAPQLVLPEFAPSAGGWLVDRHPRMLVDVNNDTQQDIVGFGQTGVWVSHSTGTGFAAPQLVLNDFGYNTGWRVDLHPRFVADLNNDGYKDIVGFGQESVYRSLGGPNGFATARGMLRELVAAGHPYNMNNTGAWAPRFVADVTGDNMADLVAFSDTNVRYAKSSAEPPIEPPAAPTNLRVLSATQTSLFFGWDDNATDERRFFTFFGKAGEELKRSTTLANRETALFLDLEPDTEYCFTVQAESIWGVSTVPAPVCGVTKPKPVPTPTPTPQGFSRIDVFNCNSEERSVNLWMFDGATNTWTQHGTVPSMWKDGGCPGTATPTKVTLPDGHALFFVAVDPGNPGCGVNDPTVPFCQRSKFQVFGKSDGGILTHRVD